MHFGSLINFLLLDLCCTGFFVVFFLFVCFSGFFVAVAVGWLVWVGFLTVSYIHLPTLRIPATSTCQRWGCCSTPRTVKPLPRAGTASRLLPPGKKPPEPSGDPPAPSLPKDAGVSPAEPRKLSPPGKVWAGGRHLARPRPRRTWRQRAGLARAPGAAHSSLLASET